MLIAIFFILILLGYMIAFEHGHGIFKIKNDKVSAFFTMFHLIALLFFWLNVYFFYYYNFDLKGQLAEAILFWLVFFSGFFGAVMATLENQPILLQLYFRLIRAWPIVIFASPLTPVLGKYLFLVLWEIIFGFESNLYEDKICRIDKAMFTDSLAVEVYVYDGFLESRYTFPTQVAISQENVKVTQPGKDELLIQIYSQSDKSHIDSIFISSDTTTCSCCTE